MVPLPDRERALVGHRAAVGGQRYVLAMPPRPAPRDLRASDADRERVIAMLGDALADGRISHGEHSERISAALSARTLGDLSGLTADLAPPERQPVRVDGGQPVAALFSTAERSGR